jgi:hypothetical protein
MADALSKPCSYNVAFRYEGIVTWTGFADKAAFDAWRLAKGADQEVVEEGISVERCIQLVFSTPPGARIEAAYAHATMADGQVNDAILRHELMKAKFGNAQYRPLDE